MQGSTHIALGTLIGAAVAGHYHIPFVLPVGAVISLAVFGSALPDADLLIQPFTHIRGHGRQASQFLAHRGLTHSLVGIVVMLLLALVLPIGAVGAAALLGGYLSHLFVDSLSQGGIGVLWPASRRFQLLPERQAIVVGGSIDWLITVVSLVGTIGILILAYGAI